MWRHENCVFSNYSRYSSDLFNSNLTKFPLKEFYDDRKGKKYENNTFSEK